MKEKQQDGDGLRKMPQSLDAEKGLLGSILLAPNRVLGETRWLGAKHFYHAAHGLIFERLLEMLDKGVPIDLISLTQALEDRKRRDRWGNLLLETELEWVGGAAAVTDLFTFVPTASNADYYAKIVAEKAQLRGVIEAAIEMSEGAYTDDKRGPEQFLDECESKLLALRTDRSFGQGMRKLAKPLEEALDGIEKLYKGRGKEMYPETGLVDFDRMTGGFKPGQFVVFGARPGVGKTALMSHCARYMGEKGRAVAIFSLEMTSQEIAQRYLCAEAPLEINQMRYGMFKRDFRADLMKAFCRLENLPIWIDDTPALTCFDFRARARRVRIEHEVQVIYIDYLQLLRSISKRAQESRYIEVSEISMTLKATAKELGVAIVACAQLGRAAERTSAPRVADLKESGQIDQDADIVALLHRPDKDDEAVKLIVAKQRNGPEGEVELRFEKQYARFHSVTKKKFSNNPDERQQHNGD